MKIKLTEVNPNELYEGAVYVLKREHKGLTPNGNPLHGQWVLRNKMGDFLDIDTYRNDIAERHGLELVSQSWVYRQN